MNEDYDAFFFSAPPLTGPRRHAMLFSVLPDDGGHPCALSLRTRRHDCGFPNCLPVMLVREPVHGIQALLEEHKT